MKTTTTYAVQEVDDAPYRCPFCAKEYDPTTVAAQLAPQTLIALAVGKARAQGRSFAEVQGWLRHFWDAGAPN